MADLPTLRAKVEAAKALAAKATPGPYHVIQSNNATPHVMHEGGADWTDYNDEDSVVVALPARYQNALNNAKLMAAAPDLVTLAADLLDEVDRARLSASCAGFDLIAIGAACDIRDNEYPLQAVQRVVAELTAIRAALGNGADEAVWRPGETMAEAAGRLRGERDGAHAQNQRLRNMIAKARSIISELGHCDPTPASRHHCLRHNSGRGPCPVEQAQTALIEATKPAGHEGPHAEALGDNGGPND